MDVMPAQAARDVIRFGTMALSGIRWSPRPDLAFLRFPRNLKRDILLAPLIQMDFNVRT